jgi:hypothetical protein
LSTPDSLARLATHLRQDPFFLASHPALHADDALLCERLSCDLETLTRLRLCQMPRSDEEVRRIAETCGVSEGRLAKLLHG